MKKKLLLIYAYLPYRKKDTFDRAPVGACDSGDS
jgi:hypothetical protein